MRKAHSAALHSRKGACGSRAANTTHTKMSNVVPKPVLRGRGGVSLNSWACPNTHQHIRCTLAQPKLMMMRLPAVWLHPERCMLYGQHTVDAWDIHPAQHSILKVFLIGHTTNNTYIHIICIIYTCILRYCQNFASSQLEPPCDACK